MHQFALGNNPPVVYADSAPWYDDKKHIALALLDLESFNELIATRHIAGYDLKKRLNEFYVFGGRWNLDSCGNVTRATEDPLPEALRLLMPVATKREFWDFHKIAHDRGLVQSDTISFAMKDGIPPVGVACAHCKQVWSIRNIYDCVVTHSTEVYPLANFVGRTLRDVKRSYAGRTDATYRMQQDILIRNDKYINLAPKYPETEVEWKKDVVMNQRGWLAVDDGVTDERIIEAGDEGFFNRWQYFHVACRDAEITSQTQQQFREILRGAGYPELEFVECPNEYGSGAYRGPWLLFSFMGETIRIGWRKRVIEIDWSRIATKRLRAMIAKSFASVESTHADTYVHANDAREATKFLADIRGSLNSFYGNSD